VINNESSKIYLENLETKLKKVKGISTKEVTSKDVLGGLTQLREAHLRGFIATDDRPQEPFFSAADDSVTILDIVHSRLYPERTALSPDELRPLASNDELSLQHSQLSLADNQPDCDVRRESK